MIFFYTIKENSSKIYNKTTLLPLHIFSLNSLAKKGQQIDFSVSKIVLFSIWLIYVCYILYFRLIAYKMGLYAICKRMKVDLILIFIVLLLAIGGCNSFCSITHKKKENSMAKIRGISERMSLR